MVSEIELIKNAVAGDRDSQFRLGRMYRDGVSVGADKSKAIKWFSAASDSGHIRAKYELALLLEEKGDDEEKTQIPDLLIYSAEHGEREAMLKVARMYRDGNMVEKDPTKSANLYRKCIDSGSKSAKLELAEILYKSESEIDRLESIKYCYELAVDGNRDAMFRLYLQYRYAVGTRKNMEIAKKWLEKAAELGHNGAKRELESIKND